MTDQSWPRPSDVDRVIARINSDEAFKALLLSDANAALTAFGIDVPNGVTVKVHENTPATLNFILPATSRGAELSDASLEAVTGGVANYRPTK